MTTGEFQEWQRVSDRIKYLARRYFLEYPEQLRVSDNETPETPYRTGERLENGVVFIDRRAR